MRKRDILLTIGTGLGLGRPNLTGMPLLASCCAQSLCKCPNLADSKLEV